MERFLGGRNHKEKPDEAGERRGGRSMIEEKIRQWCAAATVEEAGERVVVVPDRDVAEVCRRLHDDAEEPMDFMRDLVAADGDGRSERVLPVGVDADGRPRDVANGHGRARGSFPALGVPDMENGGNQGTRGIRFLRHTLHGASRHAPPLPA